MKSNIYNPPIKMDGEIIYPIRNYAINLDDLENIEGFNNSGQRDQLYRFQLNNRKVYVRKEIPPGMHFDRSIKNKPFYFIIDEYNHKLIAIPSKYEWEIDLQINNATYRSYVDEIRILNSGKIIGSYVSVHNSYNVLIKLPVLTFVNDKYYLALENSKEGHLQFKPENSNIGVAEPPIGSTIIIEGIIVNSSAKKKEILPGLLISALISLSGKFEFKIILVKETGYVIKFVTPGVTLLQQAVIDLNYIKIHDFYHLSRVRLTTQPVNDYEISYL